MIIEMIMTVLYNVFSLLTTPIDIPDLPSNAMTVIDQFIEYIVMGIGIVSQYTHYSYLVKIFMIVVAVEVGIHLYDFVMYILKKIPMANIK